MNIVNRKNITRLAFVIVILSFVLSTFVSLWSLRLMAERNIQELNKSLASLIYDSISSDLSEPVTVARSMAQEMIPALREGRSPMQNIIPVPVKQKSCWLNICPV